jgi:DNA mismatch repair protein MutL
VARITVLSDVVCNQIAAGEVVERPAAVVKELMENSVDAGSTKIAVKIAAGGRREIAVLDNGSGMSTDDALLAIERHATSKIHTLDDLLRIQSLGFRGEALPSIAAVSRFELITREAQAATGTRIFIEAGILKDVRETGCPAGTRIVVRDLFFNVPARRKFLRSRDTETAHINDQFLRLAMAHPGVHLQLTHQDRMLYDLLQTDDYAARVRRILGAEPGAALQPFRIERPPLKLEGLAGPPELQRANTHHLFVYVNGRPVWDRLLNRAILMAYESLLPRGKFPVVVLFVELPGDLVDVNVHPTKREVRFRHARQVMDGVRDAVGEALQELQKRRWQRPLAADHGPLQASRFPGIQEQESRFIQPAISAAEEFGFPPGGSATQLSMENFSGFADQWVPSQGATEGCEPKGEPRFARLPILGQIANSYILLQAPDGLIFIDQHAAHERILYERLTAPLDPERAPRQRLVQSMIVEFMPREASVLRRWLSGLTGAGFEMEPFGGNSFVIHAVPDALSGLDCVQLLHDLLGSAHEEENLPTGEMLMLLAKSAACHGALKARQKLNNEEVRQLIEELDRTLTSATCPHGRPLWWKLTHAEIARFFHRFQTSPAKQP